MNPREMIREYEGKVFDFGVAVRLMKAGFRVCRQGWNGKSQWVTLQRGYPDGIAINQNTAEATGIEQGTVCIFRPYFMLKTAGVETAFVPWAPSVSDALAEDYMVVL